MTTTLVRITAVAMLIGLQACASHTSPSNAARDYYDAGLRYEAAKNYEAARLAFQHALTAANEQHLPPATISAATYNLGRMTGYTCDFPAALKFLGDSLREEEALKAPDAGNITKRLSELARLTFDMQMYSRSAAYYERDVPALEKAGVVNIDPIGFALLLDDAGAAFEKSGDAAKAGDAHRRATVLRASNPTRAAGFTPLYYRDVCAK
jgi:tetratricopeptide (TPR) repeat protein